MVTDPDAMLLRQLDRLEWKDPVPFLREIARVEPAVAVSTRMSAAAKAMRTNRQKLHRERWHAAMFAYGIGCRNGYKTEVSVPAKGDPGYELMHQLGVDAFVAMFEPPDQLHYGLVQLKELVADEWNRTASLQDIVGILNDRSRYPDPCRTHAVIYVSRGGTQNIGDVRIDDRWMGVWILGPLDPGRRRLRLIGDVQNPTVTQTDFDYPLPQVTVARPRIWTPR